MPPCYLGLFALALFLRLACALWVQEPGYVDAYYYYHIAENWYNGHGLTESVVWNYQAYQIPAAPISQTAPNLDHPAFAYWMPFATLLAVTGFIATQNVSFWAASLPFMLIAAALPPLAYWLGQLAFGRSQRRYSLFMAAIMLFPGRYFLFFNAPDNFAPFALLSLLCLMATWAGLYRHPRWLLAAGGLGGLAYLSRSDGLLLVVALAISFVVQRCQKPEEGEQRPGWGWLGAGLGVALLVVLPWLGRSWATFEAPVAPGNSKALYLRNYTDLFSYGLPLDPRYYFDWGLSNIAASKLSAAGQNLLLLSVQGLFLAAPAFLVGLIFVRKNKLFLPFLVYLVVLYLTMTLAFTEIGGHGTLFHSAGGLLPYQAGAVLAGTEGGLNFLARKRGAVSRQVKQLGFLLAGLLILLAAALTLFYAIYAGASWDDDYHYSQKLGNWFRTNNLAESAIIVGEPLSYYYMNHQKAIGQASDGLEANLAAARQFGASYLVLGIQHYDALHPLYLAKQAPGLQLVAEFDGNQVYRIVAQP